MIMDHQRSTCPYPPCTSARPLPSSCHMHESEAVNDPWKRVELGASPDCNLSSTSYTAVLVTLTSPTVSNHPPKYPPYTAFQTEYKKDARWNETHKTPLHSRGNEPSHTLTTLLNLLPLVEESVCFVDSGNKTGPNRVGRHGPLISVSQSMTTRADSPPYLGTSCLG